MDRTKTRRRRAPIVCWYWAMAFGLLFTVGLEIAVKHYKAPPSQAFYEFNRPRIEAFEAATAGSDGLTVVALGNSRLKYAMLEDDALSELATHRGAGPMHFLRIANNWAIFEDYALLQDEILNLRPDVVLLQLELLAAERGKTGRRLQLRDYVLWSIVGLGPWNPRNEDQQDNQFNKPCKLERRTALALDRRIKRTEEWVSLTGRGSSSKMVKDFVRRANALGIEVVLLAIPQAREMEALRSSYSPRLASAGSNLAEALEGTSLLFKEATVADDEHCDFVHMNEKGREAYSAWLVTELARRRGQTAAKPR